MRYGGLRADRDILQMDPCLSYGVSEYVAMGCADDNPVRAGRVAVSAPPPPPPPRPPQAPGIGIEGKEALHALFREHCR